MEHESPILTFKRVGQSVHGLGLILAQAKNADNTRDFQTCIVKLRDHVKMLDWLLAKVDADASERVTASGYKPHKGPYSHPTYDELCVDPRIPLARLIAEKEPK